MREADLWMEVWSVLLYLISANQSEIHVWLRDVKALSCKKKCFIMLFELLSGGLNLQACTSPSSPFMLRLSSRDTRAVQHFCRGCYPLSAPMWHRLGLWPPAYPEMFWKTVIPRKNFNITTLLHVLQKDYVWYFSLNCYEQPLIVDAWGIKVCCLINWFFLHCKELAVIWTWYI